MDLGRQRARAEKPQGALNSWGTLLPWFQRSYKTARDKTSRYKTSKLDFYFRIIYSTEYNTGKNKSSTCNLFEKCEIGISACLCMRPEHVLSTWMSIHVFTCLPAIRGGQGLHSLPTMFGAPLVGPSQTSHVVYARHIIHVST